MRRRLSPEIPQPVVLLRLILIAVLLTAVLSSCLGQPPQPPAPVPTTQAATPDSTAQITPTLPAATPTIEPVVRLIFYVPEDSDPLLAARLEPLLEKASQEAGLVFETAASLTRTDLDAGVRLVVALEPAANISDLAAAAPTTQFLSAGIAGLKPSQNLSVVQSPGPDLHGFLAGYTAALITPDWRVGVITVSGTQDGSAAGEGFAAGAIYFCGLCRQVYPPFYDTANVYIKYPLSVEIPAGADESTRKAAADTLIERSVKTIYLPSGAYTPALGTHLAEAGITVIGGVLPPDISGQRWAASLNADFVPAVVDLLPAVLSGEGGFERTAPLQFESVDPELLSPGRQQLAENILEELLLGYIHTGLATQQDPSP